jgi:hypothetical protein
VRSFGDIKGLLTFNEVNSDKSPVKVRQGSIVSAYVLFNKKKSGLALTLDKKKARKNIKVKDSKMTFDSYLPDEECSK